MATPIVLVEHPAEHVLFDGALTCDVVLPARFDTGARVVMHAKPSFWPKRGTLQLQAKEIRAVGLGDLLARIEQLKRTLAAEGLFAPARKRPTGPVNPA